MITQLKNMECYAPAALGKVDVLISGGSIAAMAAGIDIHGSAVQVVDAPDCLVVPGFVDSLAHIIGGGGEGGFRSRTSELRVDDAIRAGVTTLVGVLGTDAVTRTLSNLLAKARALDEEGLTCFCHTGSYQIPARTLMRDVMEDLVLIDKFIGVGEVAIADHRSSQPSPDEIKKLASQARVGGMLAGKAGIVSVHVGAASAGVALLEQVVAESDIPISQFYPTHMNRNQRLLEQGFGFVQQGGYIDFTTSTTAQELASGEIKCSRALKLALENSVDVNNITFSSDANASLPLFDERNAFIGLGEGRIASLFEEVVDAVKLEGIALETALRVITCNPAAILKLPRKGQLRVGSDADLLLLDRDSLRIRAVMAGGRWLYAEPELSLPVTRTSLFI
ncbi:beta-aspartyl-peptidase [Permianibacter sp. IMCC34836]|uniref:beta-aspartyl-peptidase n=1 Tax=Permianibacter fluminis TaxID=2738515 RepID=UPI001553D60F|nr:beta-aspartyl-peptidase [Permianibacter fluminis]NQD37578.1 beta-aspartyl-peptidase [Permianibacter fluminis]